MKIFRYIAAILITCMLLTCTGCFSLFDSDYDSSYTPSYDDTPATSSLLSDFSIDTTRIAVDSTTDICAYVYAPNATNAVELWNDADYITDMFDNGISPDLAAGDGIYSVCINLTTEGGDDAGKQLYMHARTGNEQSNIEIISVLPLPTAEDTAEVSNILDDLNFIMHNSASTDEQLSSASAYILDLQSEGSVLEYYTSDCSIDFVHSSGMLCNFTPYEENTLAVGDGSAISIISFDPYSNAPEFLDPISSFSTGEEFIYANESTWYAGTRIASALPNYSYPDYFDLDNGEVTLASLSNMSGNQVIMWNGHGGYSYSEGPFLATCEVYDENRAAIDNSYFNRTINGELVICSGENRLGVTGKYVRRNLPDLSGSIVYLNACHGGNTDVLASAFLSKGAISVIGYTHSVYIPYAVAMQYATLTRMTKINPATNDYFSLSEAIASAKVDYGDYDTHFIPTQPGKTDAYIITFGADPTTVRLASAKGAPAPQVTPIPDPTPAPPVSTPEPTPAVYSNYDAHEAYKEFLRSYSWIPFCPSDLSEIPPAEYDDYGLGSYYVCDIDNNGIDELVIKAGQSISDMSMTFFTYADGKVIFIGSTFTGDAWLQEMTTATGAIIVEHHGGMGIDTYVDIVNGYIAITGSYEYNYEQPGYTDDKASVSIPVNVYNVHDLSGL